VKGISAEVRELLDVGLFVIRDGMVTASVVTMRGIEENNAAHVKLADVIQMNHNG